MNRFLVSLGIGTVLIVGFFVFKINFPFDKTVTNPPPPPPDSFSESRNQFSPPPPEKTKTLVTPAVESATPIANATQSCLNTQSQNFDCYESYYRGLIKNQGLKAAFDDLKKRYDTNAYVKSQCHPLTHVIGRAAVEDSYGSVAEAYTNGDSFCWSGYYHGVLEGIIGKIGRRRLFDEIDTVCADIPGKAKYSFDYYNCVHGLGHGIMAITNTELFESLTICDRLSGVWERSSCWSGVFMENVIVDGKNHFTKYLKPDNPLYPCDAINGKYRQVCYLMQTSYMLKVTAYDFPKVFGLCRTVENEYFDTCFQSLGRDASGSTVSDIERTKAYCLLGQSYREQSNCVIGAVKDFVSYHHSDKEANEFCGALPNDLQAVCRSTAESYYTVF